MGSLRDIKNGTIALLEKKGKNIIEISQIDWPETV